jgi:hypothetical protein
MLENMALRKTFGPNTDEVTENWTNRHKKELYDLKH